MENKTLSLVLDQGSHASRAIVFNAQGGKVAEASLEIHTLRKEDRVELDINELLESLNTVALEVYDQLGADQRNLKVAGLATQRSNILCWRKKDYAPLSPVLSWQDRRAEDKLNDIDFSYIQAKTGLFANAHYGASKLAWCLENIDEVKKAATQHDLVIGPMASYLASRLTDTEVVADPVNASRTLLWNIHNMDWDKDLCKIFGIDISTLPPCVTSNYGFGCLTLRDQQVPLSIVTGDLSAAAFTNGTPLEDIAYVTLGTGAFVQRITHEPGSHSPLLDGVLWISQNKQLFSLEGTVNGGGSAISWLATQHGIDDKSILHHLKQWLEEVQNPPLFLNAVSGIGSPLWCSHETSRFNRDATLPEQTIAVLESVLFLLMLNLQIMHEMMPKARCINVSGGLANIEEFCQKLADLSGLLVKRNNETEGTARGLAYLLSECPKKWPVNYTNFNPVKNISLEKRWSNWLQFISDSVSDHCRYFKEK